MFPVEQLIFAIFLVAIILFLVLWRLWYRIGQWTIKKKEDIEETINQEEDTSDEEKPN
jgi:hypothetical protein